MYRSDAASFVACIVRETDRHGDQVPAHARQGLIHTPTSYATTY